MLGLHHGGFLLKISGLRCADRRLLLLEKRLVGVRFNFHQQVAFLDPHPILDRQFNDFASNFGRNLDFNLRLYFPRRRNRLHDGFANRRLCCDRNRLLPFAPDNRPNDPEHNQGDQSVNDLLFTPGATLFHRQRRGGGCAYGLVHRRGGSRGEGVRISRLFDSCKRNPVHTILRCAEERLWIQLIAVSLDEAGLAPQWDGLIPCRDRIW